MSVASLLGLLLGIFMEIWYRECGPFRPNFAVVAILGHIGNTISPWGEGLSQEGRGILVAYSFGDHLYVSGRRRAFVANNVARKVLKTRRARTTRTTHTD